MRLRTTELTLVKKKTAELTGHVCIFYRKILVVSLLGGGEFVNIRD